jgi:predicted N-acetyltransferase YhbS
MSIMVNLTEKEILETPNDSELGEKVRARYWEQKELQTEEQKLREKDDESYILVADDNGMVIGMHLPSEDDFTDNGYDKCVMCGKVSPYPTRMHIDLRIGYVEGSGQGCFQPEICNK